MHSIRSKITLMTVTAIVIVMVTAAVSGVMAIRDIGNESAKRTLLLLCETGEKNLDHYFQSVEQSVEMVSAYVESDLDGLDDEKLEAHMKRVDEIFKRLTYKTQGVTTYYYRLDPEVSRKVKGFWYVNVDGGGFKKHEVTDLTLYDEDSDKSGLVWFTVPKDTGEAVWLSPYVTENLDVRVISYNVPVFYDHKFIGVIGIEIEYTTMAEQVDNIRLYETGYAFINDKEGNIVYHPEVNVMENAETIKVPNGMLSEEKFIRYNFHGEDKMAVWLPLVNGMRLNVTVPVSEINREWVDWSVKIVILFAVLLLLFIILITTFTGRITKPLTELAYAARELDKGNYDVKLNYNGKDEVGTLTRTFNRMSAHLRTYISDLNDLAYADALTSVHNRGAFDIYVKNMETELKQSEGNMEFAVCVFDCNRLKRVNDQNGHDKGDIYLKETASVICEVFDHCPVFRTGGDEFATILMDKSYEKRDELIRKFDERCAERRAAASEVWNEVDVARGLAVYDPEQDDIVNDVIHRADKTMYENKWKTENGRN